jgi:hypothetical protein
MKKFRLPRKGTSAVVGLLFIAFYAACSDDASSPAMDSAAGGVTSCAGLEETSARLACYDRLAGRDGSSPPTTTDGAVGAPQCSAPSPDASDDASNDANVSTDPDASADAGRMLTCPVAGRQLWYAQGCCCSVGTPGELCGCTCVDVDKCASGVFKYSPKNGDHDYCNVPESTPPVSPPPNYLPCLFNGGGSIYYDSVKFDCRTTITTSFNPK